MCWCVFFFFNDTATTEIYTLSLHDALPISRSRKYLWPARQRVHRKAHRHGWLRPGRAGGKGLLAHHSQVASEGRRGIRSEEHTSELQSRQYLVCRLLLEKKKHQNVTMQLLS